MPPPSPRICIWTMAAVLLLLLSSHVAVSNAALPMDQCHYASASDKCLYLRQNSPYQTLDFYYCSIKSLPMGAFLIIIWIAYLFVFFAMTANHFCENLSTISGALGLSQTVSGVTLAALGNGANDLFSTFAAVRNKATSLALGELLGSAMFTTSCLLGIVIFIAPFDLPKAPFFRDTIGFLGALILVLTLVLLKSTITTHTGIILVGYYIAYVSVVILANQINRYLRRKRATKAKVQIGNEEDVVDEESGWTNAFSNEDPAPTGETDHAINVHDGTHHRDSPTIVVNYAQSSAKLFVDTSFPNSEDASSEIDDENTPLLSTSVASDHPRVFSTSPSVVQQEFQDAGDLLLPTFPSRTFKRAIPSRYHSLHRKWSETLSVGSPTDQLVLHHNSDSALLSPTNTRWLESRVASTFSGILSKSVIDSINEGYTSNTIANGIAANDMSLPLTPIISHSFKPKSMTVFEALLPPDRSHWKSMSLLMKLWFIIQIPLLIMLRSTIPVVTRHEYDKGLINAGFEAGAVSMLANGIEDDVSPFQDYDPLHPGRVTLSLVLAPFLISFSLYNSWSLIMVVIAITTSILVGSILAFLFNYATTRRDLSSFHVHIAGFGFAMSIVWMSLIADQLVGSLQRIGHISGIGNGILGLTVFAAGNSLGDFLTNIKLAQAGFPGMAFGASFGSPMLNLGLGIGLATLYYSYSNDDNSVSISTTPSIMAAFACVVLNLLLVLV
ncbi:hypothetical protein SeMB42_g07006, partial [Synchytrium endobioticum]